MCYNIFTSLEGITVGDNVFLNVKLEGSIDLDNKISNFVDYYRFDKSYDGKDAYTNFDEFINKVANLYIFT